MTEWSDEMLLERAPDVLWRRLLDGVLILGTGMLEPQRLSVSGGVLWELMAEPWIVGQLVREWSTRFHLHEEIARADITPVLQTWVDGGVLVERTEILGPQ